MLVYKYAGNPVKVGDKVSMKITIDNSETSQTLEGWVAVLPKSSTSNVRVNPDKEGGTYSIYPEIGDINHVEWKEANPEHWPSQEGDVWRDSFGNEYHHVGGYVRFHGTGMSLHPQTLRDKPGLKLVYRKGNSK